MSRLKPLGSEKLQGDEKLKRILEIATYKEVPRQIINETSTTEYQIKLADGNLYEIAKDQNRILLITPKQANLLHYLNISDQPFNLATDSNIGIFTDEITTKYQYEKDLKRNYEKKFVLIDAVKTNQWRNYYQLYRWIV